MAVRPGPTVRAMVITTGSGTSAKPDRLRSTPGARQPTRKRVAGLPALRPVVRAPLVRRPVPGQPAGRLPTPTAALAGPAAGCRVGTPHKAGRPLTCKLASRPPTRQPGAVGEVLPSARARSMRLRSQGCLSRARLDTRTPRLTLRPRRCRQLRPGQNRAGRGRATAGRGLMSTGCGPMSTGCGPTITRHSPMTIRPSPTTTARGPVTRLRRRSRARHGRLQDRVRQDAPSGQRPNQAHHGQSRSDRPRRGSRRQSRPVVPVVAGRALSAVAGRTPQADRLLPRSSARRLPPRRPRQRSKPRQSGPRQRSSARATTAKLQAASPPGAGAGTPCCSASLAAASLAPSQPAGSW